MSDSNAFAFGKFIPGFDFLQQLASAQKPGSGAPGLGQWVAPTVNVQELDRRITELKAVQFWLDQNVTALKATVQALEVQKMTLATLNGMNVSMAEVAKAFTVPVPPTSAPAPAPAPAPAAAPTAAAKPAPAPQWPFDQVSPKPATQPAPAPEVAAPSPLRTDPPGQHEPAAHAQKGESDAAASASEAPDAPAGTGAPSLADGMQWWGALTQQFQQIAANALREAAPVKNEGAASGDAKPARRGAAKKKAAAKRGAAKKATATKKKATNAKKAPAANKAAARESAAGRNAGWPLPPPAKPR